MQRISFCSSTASTRRWPHRSLFRYEILEGRPGFLLFRATGKDVARAFENEGGGHRWQRVPPTEKRGRVHTSTVTVAVLPEAGANEVHIDPKDVKESFTRGRGKGGQHRNKTDSCVVILHKPSGIKVRIDGGRSQHINRQTALQVLRARLQAAKQDQSGKARNANRKAQVGGGARGDKRRTIAIQRDAVYDHVTGKRTSWKQYSRGYLNELR